MSIKVLTNYDFLKNQIENAVVHNVADLSLITTPRAGQIAFDTTAKRLYYHTGTAWEVADSSASNSYLSGTSIITAINHQDTTGTINNNRLTNSSITIGTTSISLGGTVSDIAGSTINNITLTKNTTGFSLAGGTTSKTLTVSGTSTIGINSIALESGNSLDMQYAGLTLGASGATGDITIKSIDNTNKTLTLSNASLELAGTGTKLTINDTPTIAGTGKVTLNSSADVKLAGDSTATLNTNLTIGTTHQYSRAITLKTTEVSDTPDITATFPKVASMTLVGEDTTQALTNKTINGLTITPVTSKTLDLSVASLKIGNPDKTGNITITSNDTNDRTLTLGGSVSLNGASSATLNSALTVGATSTYTGAVSIKSAGTSATEIIGPNGGTTTLLAGTMVETNDGRLHYQNTDAGTSSSTFYINTNGVKLKSANTGTENIELQIRNNADDAYASLRVKNLYVTGTETIINTETVSVADNFIELNNNITAPANNDNAGLTVKRFNTSSEAEQPAELIFDESSGKWQTTYINTSNTGNYTLALTNKFTIAIGNGIATSFAIPHNLNTRDAMVSIRETGNNYAMVLAEVRFTDVNTVTIITAEPPTSNQYTVTIIG